MKIGKIVVIILLLTAVAAFFTNPEKEAHKLALKETLRHGLSKALEGNGVKENNALHGLLTNDMYENYFWSDLIEKSVDRKNYYLFSTSTVTYNGKEYTAGIGILGKVYIFPQLEKEVVNRVNKLIKDGGGLINILK